MTEEQKKEKLIHIIIAMDEIIHDSPLSTFDELNQFDIERLSLSFNHKSQYLKSYFEIFYNTENKF